MNETQMVTAAEIEYDLRHEQEDDATAAVKKVTVTVDGKKRQVRPGTYIVNEFKRAIKVDSTYELEQVIHGQLTPLDDAAKIVIKGGEVFVSHVRQGGSS